MNRLVILASASLLCIAASLPAAELPVKDGLELWLDAAKASEKPPTAPDSSLALWIDQSGHKRHLFQEKSASQPKLLPSLTPDGKHPVVRFDGQDDSLLLAGPGKSYKDITLFLVAAPRTNAGGFRGLLAFNKKGVNDYTSGLTIDMSWVPSLMFNVLNLEGAGFGGAVDVMGDEHPLTTFHLLSTTLTPGKTGVKLYVDGKASGSRDRTAGELRADELRLGVRHYSNTAQPTFDQGYFDGDIAEVLLYDRVLSDEERKLVEKYLSDKHRPLLDLPPAAANEGLPLVSVKDPPAVQVHVPGFTVQELPLDLTNINNLAYRHDGKLVALAYNGNIYLLSDTNKDGLEDEARLIFDNAQGSLRGPIGMALTPSEYIHGAGLFVAAKGKLALLTDTDGDNVLDKEQVVATGWKELPHGVDTLGVAIAKDGSVFFGIGCADFTNGYLLDKDGKSQFDLKSQRGTIQRLSPDLKERETWCTGIRYSVDMEFNAAGDLFCTDQEGATWLANGNPFDELLHIQKDRHFGFPPRHPRHLPNVIDEPSTFDYAPQHQSTCGLCFNEPVNGGPVFGPKWWRGDAFVAGYSRGKLYRTKLAKTAAGYIAESQLFATLNMLTADCCVSPRGELVVACHSGGPDWGSGPSGKGKLYKIFYADEHAPQPVRTWCESPFEVRVAFDRPISPEQIPADLAERTSIEYGKYVAAADRFESLRPGYAVVVQQMMAPRHELKVRGIALSSDRRTLILATDRHSKDASYALTLPAFSLLSSPKNSGIKQHAEIDLAYRPAGVFAAWTADTSDQKDSQDLDWSGWLPTMEMTVAKSFLRGTAELEGIVARKKGPAKLQIGGSLNLANMLRPAIQPGSMLDHVWGDEKVTLTFISSRPFTLLAPSPKAIEAKRISAAKYEAEFTVVPEKDSRPFFKLNIASGKEPLELGLTWSTAEDPRPRPMPPHRFLPLWLDLDLPSDKSNQPLVPPELTGGDWLRGRDVFYAEQSQCSKCHAIDGKGATIGPNLSNLRHRDYHSVLRDISQPSYALNPDFLTYNVLLEDGRAVSGVVLTEGEKLRIGDAKGIELVVAKDEISAMKPGSISTMPEGLLKTLPPDKLRDLLTFLLLAPPEELRPATITRPGAPPPRKRKEVEAVLKDSEKLDAEKLKPLSIVLVAGPKDHGENEHDYPDWQKRWSKLLPLAPKTTVSTADVWPSAEQLKTADVLVFYSANPAWSPEKAKEIDAFQARGGGMVFLHFAVNGQRAPDQLAERIGLAWENGKSKFRHGALDLKFAVETKHPILRNFERAHFEDESYWDLLGDPKKITLLASGDEDGQPRPLLWAYERGKGRVFCSILGHYSWTFDDPLFRTLVLRGIAWSARENVERFNDVVQLGARVE